MRRTRIKVIYENKDVTREIIEDVESVSLTDNLSSTDDMSISMKDKSKKWMSDWMPEKGGRIKIELVGENWEKAGDIKIMSFGPFSVDSLRHSGSPQKVSISGISTAIESSITGEKKNKAWENIDLKSIAGEIAGTGGLNLYFDSDYNPQYKRIEQNEEADLQLLKRLCDNECFELKTENEQIIIFDERKYEKTVEVLEIAHNNSINYSINNDDVGSYDSCIVTYFDRENKTEISGEYTAERTGYSRETGRILRIKNSDGIQGTTEEEIKGELKRRAQNLLRQANKRTLKISISNMMGSFDIYAGAMIKLSDFGNYSGRYMIKNIKRSVGNKYTMAFELQREVGY